MDFLPRLYRSFMRLYRDRPDVLTAGRWYWCPPGARAITYLSRFGSLKWDSNMDMENYQPIGEVSVIPGRVQGETNARYTGQNWCGGEQVWTEGALYSQRNTPVLDADGVPLCCITSVGPIGGVSIDGGGYVPVLPGSVVWLQNQSIAPPPSSGEILDWTDSSGFGHDLVAAGPGSGAQRTPLSCDQAGGLFGLTTNMTFGTSVTLGLNATVYVVGQSTGVGVLDPGPRVVGPTPSTNSVLSWDSVHSRGGNAVQSITGRGIPRHLTQIVSLRQNYPGTLRLYIDGLLVDSVTTDPAGIISITGLSLWTVGQPSFAGTGVIEFLCFPFALTDAQDSYVLSYLRTTFGVWDLDTLYLHPCDPLFLHPSDPLVLR